VCKTRGVTHSQSTQTAWHKRECARGHGTQLTAQHTGFIVHMLTERVARRRAATSRTGHAEPRAMLQGPAVQAQPESQAPLRVAGIRHHHHLRSHRGGGAAPPPKPATTAHRWHSIHQSDARRRSDARRAPRGRSRRHRRTCAPPLYSPRRHSIPEGALAATQSQRMRRTQTTREGQYGRIPLRRSAATARPARPPGSLARAPRSRLRR